MLGHKVHVNLLTFSIKKVKWLLGVGELFLHLLKWESNMVLIRNRLPYPTRAILVINEVSRALREACLE